MQNALKYLAVATESEKVQDTIIVKPIEKSQFFNLSALGVADLIRGLIQLGLLVAAIIFFFMLVIGGIRWITSGGDKGQTEAARGQITAALVGLVIVFAAWAIAQLLNVFFGIDIFSLKLPQVSAPK